MPRVFEAKRMLEGVCYDAQRLLREGQTRDAYKILLHKIKEIHKLEKCGYCRVKWEQQEKGQSAIGEYEEEQEA